MGKIVHQDVELDVNGIPIGLPKLFYQRVPTIKTEPGSYEDWKRKKPSMERLVSAIAWEIGRLRVEVGRLGKELKLRQRPPIPQESFDSNRKIVEILEGIYIKDVV